MPIPDHCVPPGCRRLVISAPNGDLTDDTIRPVEAVAGIVDGQPRIAVLIQLEDRDLERLQVCGGFWLTMMTGQIPPFALNIADEQELQTLSQEG